MLCGSFSESKEKKLSLADVDGRTFVKVLDLWCGREDRQELGLCEMKDVAILADRFQIAEVVSAVEDVLLKKMSVETCGEILMWSGGCGMQRLEAEALKMAAERFEELVKTAAFMRMGEEVLGILLDDDRLTAREEEAVWEAVVGWMEDGAGAAAWRGVVNKIRFPLMKEEYLRIRVVEMVGRDDREWMEGVVAEALLAKEARQSTATMELHLLGAKALERRAGSGVRWEEYIEETRRPQPLRASGTYLRAIVACDERICGLMGAGPIMVWSKSSAELERTLQADAHGGTLFSLAFWNGRLVGGHHSGQLSAWNLETGVCEQLYKGHEGTVLSLATCGQRLASGGRDGIIQLWVTADVTAGGAAWECERSISLPESGIMSLAGWGDVVLGGSITGTVGAWDAATGAHLATLGCPSGNMVKALVVRGERLYCALHGGMIREWALGTWEELRSAHAFGRDIDCRELQCLVVSGTRLVCGTSAYDGTLQQVQVWGLEKLDRQLTLQHLDDVRSLLAVDGEVWGGVGSDVVVWGRR